MVRNKFLSGLVLFLIFCPLSHAQANAGNIYGKLTDSKRGPLPGARVTLTGNKIGKVVVTTGKRGHFRFFSLAPADDYRLTFELRGFKTSVLEKIPLEVGRNIELNIVMEKGKPEEKVQVVAKIPVSDSKKSTVQANFSRKVLQGLPSARDPWGLLELTAGVMVDRENVGGNESGEQSAFTARGDSGSNTEWNIDGVNITDPAGGGASPMYYNFDMFEEMNIQTAANDVTAVTGGININFTTSRGGNKLSGRARFYLTDKKFQSENVPSDVNKELLTGNKIKSIHDYGLSLAGPIFENGLWFWGSYGVQNIQQVNIDGQPDNSDIITYNFKLNALLGKNRFEAYGVYNIKEKDGWRRPGGYLDAPEAAYMHKEPSSVFKVQDELILSQNIYFSAKASYVPLEFSLEPKGGKDKIMYWDRAKDIRWNTADYYETRRPTWSGEFVGDFFLEKFLAAAHDFKFGLEYKNSVIDFSSGYGNGVQARLQNGVPYEVRFFNHFYEKFYANRISAYLQDIMDIGRLTLHAGVRYDRQRGGILEGKNSPTNVDLMKNIKGSDYNWKQATQAGAPFPFTWNMFSPRAGLILDLFNNGRTLFKANFSIYGSQFDAAIAFPMWFLYGYHRFFWSDINSDNQVEADELTYRSTTDLTDLASKTKDLIKDYYDPNLTPEKTMEAVVGVEQELSADFGIGLNFLYRKLYEYTWSKLLVYDYLQGNIRQVQSEDWIQAGTIDDHVYWDFDYNRVDYTFTDYLTKRPDFDQTYWAVELTFKKRLGARWMMDGSFTYQDHRAHYKSRQSFQDPTNHLPVEKLDGQPMAYEMSGSGGSQIFLNSRWMVKWGGLYELPLGFNLSATISAREGFVSPEYAEDYEYYRYDLEFPRVWTEKFGSTRDPNIFLVNLMLEKKIGISGANFYLNVDGFNILNSNVRLAQYRNRSAENYGQTLCIMSPRIFRFGVRIEF